MRNSRPDYIERRIAWTKAQREARRTHPQPCDCAYCLTAAEAERLLAERIRLQRLLDTGIDF